MELDVQYKLNRPVKILKERAGSLFKGIEGSLLKAGVL